MLPHRLSCTGRIAPCAPRSATRLSRKMVQRNTFEFVNDRQQTLVATEYLPDGTPKAVLLWNHGIGEHSGRYEPVHTQMAEAGIAVYTFDAHGHGKSQPLDAGNRCLIWRFDDLVDDVFKFLSVIEGRAGVKLPTLFIGGQSLGALIATHAVMRQQDRWAGLILHSAALDVVWTPVLRMQAKVGNLLAMLLPKQQLVPAVESKHLHPNPEEVAKYVNDPLNFLGKVRARSANESLKGFRALQGKEQQFTLPIYAVHGGKDLITSIEGVKRFCARVSSKDLTMRIVEDGWHELLIASPEREENAALIIKWMTDKVAQPKL